MTGDKIISSNIGDILYKIQIMEDIKLEGDPNYPCIDYKIKGEYAKCIEDEILRENFKYLNCTPPWMTENEDIWCKGKYELSESKNAVYKRYLADIGAGLVKTQNCLPPCKEKTYQATEMGLRRRPGYKGLVIWFENEVEIIKSSWKVDALTIISNIGGFIGIGKEFFWLVILILSSLTILMSIIKQKNFNKAA